MTPKIMQLPQGGRPQIQPAHHKVEPSKGFGDIFQQMATADLQNEETGLRFSKHAAQRIEVRKIKLEQQQLDRVEQGLKTAQSKGVKDTLVLVDDLALVVNVPTRIVVTVMPRQQSHIFTNINGAVLV